MRVNTREVKSGRAAAACERRMGIVSHEYHPSFNPFRKFTYSEETYTTGRPKFIIDSVSKGRYFNVNLSTLRKEHCKLALTTIFLGTYSSAVSSVTNLIKTPYHLLRRAQPDEAYGLKERVTTASLSVGKSIYALAHVILLEVAALYGIISPLPGRSLYQDLEALRPHCGIQSIDNLEIMSDSITRVR